MGENGTAADPMANVTKGGAGGASPTDNSTDVTKTKTEDSVGTASKESGEQKTKKKKKPKSSKNSQSPASSKDTKKGSADNGTNPDQPGGSASTQLSSTIAHTTSGVTPPVTASSKLAQARKSKRSSKEKQDGSSLNNRVNAVPKGSTERKGVNNASTTEDDGGGNQTSTALSKGGGQGKA